MIVRDVVVELERAVFEAVPDSGVGGVEGQLHTLPLCMFWRGI